ncbi:hypothetical protein DPMN_124683 [Dreissena polymorpha]|uniref:Uncharacterized protein n=1 Tax=Dreissena polymorpha TaxID=45954 RepID=A0A9D4JU12_DREPO|nr:hypothetical protein DPMN_124683 [Dreissena polymorpha]
MLNKLGSTTLESRRQTAKVVMMNRVVINLVDINARSVLIPTGVNTRGHANRYIVPLPPSTPTSFPFSQMQYAYGVVSQNRWSLPRP